MPEQQGGTEAEVVEDTSPHAAKGETPQDKKEETAQEKAISLSMVSLVAAAETVGGFGPFPDTQVEVSCHKHDCARHLAWTAHTHDCNLSELVHLRAHLGCPCSRVQPAGPCNLWRQLIATAGCKLHTALEAAYAKLQPGTVPVEQRWSLACCLSSITGAWQGAKIEFLPKVLPFLYVTFDHWRCAQRAAMAAKISKEYLPWYAQLREAVGQQDGGVAHPMALIFDSAMGSRPGQQTGAPAQGDSWAPKLPENITRPADDTALCFMPVSAAGCACTMGGGSSLGILCALQCRLATSPREDSNAMPPRCSHLCCWPGLLTRLVKRDRGGGAKGRVLPERCLCMLAARAWVSCNTNAVCNCCVTGLGVGRSRELQTDLLSGTDDHLLEAR